MTHWYDGAIVVLAAGFITFLITFALALVWGDVWNWWNQAGKLLGWVILFGALIAAAIGLAVVKTPEERERDKVLRTIGEKIADHPDGGEVWRVGHGSQSSVYFKPKGKQ